jgi:hypothetical protein
MTGLAWRGRGMARTLGFEFAGAIPDYAFRPLGGLTGTRIYFKRLGASGASQASR